MRLFPKQGRTTAGISVALDTGRHTTTHARLYELDEHSSIIDSPGLQEFGLHQLNARNWRGGLKNSVLISNGADSLTAGTCDEPGCALIQAMEEGRISRRRLDFYRKLVAAYTAMPPT